MLPAASKNSRLVLLVCFFGLAILWSCRLPRLCVFDRCPRTDLPIPTLPAKANGYDLSTADAPFIAWPLARVCAETTKWTPGLVFMCDNNSGGIGNIRNFILTCLRYAIEAGATGITMPTIQTRSQDKLSDLFKGKKLPFSYFFDEEHFRRNFTAACPKITIYSTPEDIPGFERHSEQLEQKGPARQPWDMITPNNLGQRGGCDQRDLNRHVDLFGPRFRDWLDERQEKVSLPSVTASSPKLIRFNWGVQWTFPVYRDGPEFVATFGGLLRFREDILELGMETAAAMEIVAHESEGSFVGMHLRTENDALRGWPSFEEQSRAYLSKAAGLTPSPRYAYLATGNATEAAKLTSLALKEKLRVVTKHELLAEPNNEELRRRLDSLSWDQQALVDFVVLLQAEYFVGVSPSSFSMNVALKRHLKEDGLYTRPWKIGVEEGDGRSSLVGRYDYYWDDWLFMYESLWP
ncbi:hypothetical protein N0V93_005440 [Gnomoniopsis smithogilvyi]|uniref:Alternative oxidase n=1 Tax=Gnomoniopsis smithogilvyi TaxID=1191159 RepID=A0A9W9CY17_9PEZI|nr:hypothetical protein N0V93_005440 [Gnomoniopsis smithogilvyi]